MSPRSHAAPRRAEFAVRVAALTGLRQENCCAGRPQLDLDAMTVRGRARRPCLNGHEVNDDNFRHRVFDPAVRRTGVSTGSRNE